MIYNRKLHIFVSQLNREMPADGEIDISPATVSLVMNCGRHQAELISSMWKAAGFPKHIKKEEVEKLKSELDQMAKELSKQLYHM